MREVSTWYNGEFGYFYLVRVEEIKKVLREGVIIEMS